MDLKGVFIYVKNTQNPYKKININLAKNKIIRKLIENYNLFIYNKNER